MPKNILDTLSPGDTLGNGFIFVGRETERVHPSGRIYYKAIFICPVCKQQTSKAVKEINSGRIKTCGCTSKRLKTRQLTAKNRPLYNIWFSMHNRCYNPSHPGYHNYGGRGVTVCDRWHDPQGFERFELDMAPKYQPGLQLDKDIRFKGNKEYSRLACQWVTKKENSQNTRTSRYLIYDGKQMRPENVSEILNLSTPRVKQWIYRGVPKQYQHLVNVVEKE